MQILCQVMSQHNNYNDQLSQWPSCISYFLFHSQHLILFHDKLFFWNLDEFLQNNKQQYFENTALRRPRVRLRRDTLNIRKNI